MNCVNIWAVTIGWVLIVVGWFITNAQNNKRESLKELRASLDDVIRDIHETQLNALKYYTSEVDNSHQLAFEIKTSQSRILSKIERLKAIHKGYFSLEKLSEYMHALTGEDFESSHRHVRSYNDQNDDSLLNITFQTNTLINHLETDYCNIFGKH